MARSVHHILHHAVGSPVSPTDTAASSGHHTVRIGAAVVLAATFLALLIDAMVRPMAFFDLRVMQEVQQIDQSGINAFLNAIRTLTGSEGAIIAWVVVGLIFLARRWWAPAVALGLLPLGGIINEGIGMFLVERSRPHLDILMRSSLNPEERSFPSGHVTGAVMLYGLIFYAAGRIAWAPGRWLVRAGSVMILAVIGYQRVWGGAHWPTDVLAAYALGGLLLIGLVSLAQWLEPELVGRTLFGAINRTVSLGLLLTVALWHSVVTTVRRESRSPALAGAGEPGGGNANTGFDSRSASMSSSPHPTAMTPDRGASQVAVDR